MAGSSSDGEEENYWPGFVDALTTMTMVLTFIMMVLGIVVFSQSQTVQRAQLEQIADAAEVKGKEKQGSVAELKDAIIARIATLAKAGPPLKDIPRDTSKGIMDTSAEKPQVLPESTAIPQPQADSIPADNQKGGPAKIALADPAPVPFARPTFGGVPNQVTNPSGERVTSDKPETNAAEVAVIPAAPTGTVSPKPPEPPVAPPVKQAEASPPAPVQTPKREEATPPPPADKPIRTAEATPPAQAPAPVAAAEPALAAEPTPVASAAPPEPPPAPAAAPASEVEPAPPPPAIVAAPTKPPTPTVFVKPAAPSPPSTVVAAVAPTPPAPPSSLVSTVPDPEVIESKAAPTMGKRRTGATVTSTGAFIVVKFVPQSTMLAPDEQSQVRRVLRDEGTSTARTIEILALSGLGVPDITEERQRAYFRMMMLRNELIASGIQSSKIKLLVRDSTNPDDFNVVRITARS